MGDKIRRLYLIFEVFKYKQRKLNDRCYPQQVRFVEDLWEDLSGHFFSTKLLLFLFVERQTNFVSLLCCDVTLFDCNQQIWNHQSCFSCGSLSSRFNLPSYNLLDLTLRPRHNIRCVKSITSVFLDFDT